MAIASGIGTNTHLSSPENEWYSTISIDEVIPFVDHYGKNKVTDSIAVFANTTKLTFSLCRINSDGAVVFETDKMFVASNARIESDGAKFQAIKIYGIANQKVKFNYNTI